jgi:hypothetical protein
MIVTNIVPQILSLQNNNNNNLFFSPTVPLLHVLAVHSRLMLQVSETVLKCLCQLAGIPVDMQDRPSAIVPYELVVPLLCRDPSALLMQLIVLLPLHIHQSKLHATTQTTRVSYVRVSYMVMLMLVHKRPTPRLRCRAKQP